MKPHLIMPMAGAGSRFENEGYKDPKPLIKINGKPFFYWAVRSILNNVNVYDIVFVVLQEHINKFEIDKKILSYFPNSKIYSLNEVLDGPVLTCLSVIQGINDDLPIIINDCDHMFKCVELKNIFENFDFDMGLLTFKSNEPQYSYVRYDDENRVIGTMEKKVISNHAICGAYLFKSAKIFISNANNYLKMPMYDEFFLSGIYNVAYSAGLVIKDYLVDFHLNFGTPLEYKEAKGSKYFLEMDGNK